MDYLIAIGAALLGALAIFFVLSSIGHSDLRVSRVNVPRQSHPKKPRKVSRRTQDDVLDFEMEALIARELQMSSSGMNKDSKTVRPESLEEVRQRRQGNKENRRQHPAQQPAPEVAERQALIDKELGFRHVEVPQRPAKAESPAPLPAAVDDMDRKLSQFFRNNKMGKRPPATAEEDPAKTGSGGRVVVKRELTNTRVW